MKEFIDKLKSMGLTEYEAKAYLALLQKANMTAEQISNLSEVPLPRVYGVLEQLAIKGFIKILPGRPRKFEAIEPRIAFESYMKYKERMLEQELEKLKELFSQFERQLEDIYWRSRLRVKPESLITPLSSLSEMEEKTRELIRQAEREVLVFTELFTWFKRVRREVEEAVKRGVKMKVIMCPLTDESKEIARQLVEMGVEVKKAPEEWYPTRGTIVDRSKLVFLIWAPREEKKYWKPVIYQPHYTENKGLIHIFLDAFYKRWSQAKPLDGQ